PVHHLKQSKIMTYSNEETNLMLQRNGAQVQNATSFTNVSDHSHVHANDIYDKANNIRTIILCDVVVGRCENGTENKYQTSSPLIHSTVDNTSTPLLFCTFNNTQSYPAYIIHFTASDIDLY